MGRRPRSGLPRHGAPRAGAQLGAGACRGRSGGAPSRAPPGPRAFGGAGGAAQWQEAERHAVSGGRRRPPLPPAAMGTGPGVSGRRAASRPGPGLPSRDPEPCWVAGRARDGEGQVRGGGARLCWLPRSSRVSRAGGDSQLPRLQPGLRNAGAGIWGPETWPPALRGPGGGGREPTPGPLCPALPPDTPAGPRATPPPSLPLLRSRPQPCCSCLLPPAPALV